MKITMNMISTTIIIVIFSLLIINWGNNLSEYKESLESELVDASNIISALRERIDGLEADMFEMKGNINSNKADVKSATFGLSDLWFSIYYDNVTILKQFEEENSYFFETCIPQAHWRDVSLVRNYWDTNEPVKARYLVVSYDIGEIVYDKNGTISCYTMEIDSPPVECKSLCQEDNNEDEQ